MLPRKGYPQMIRAARVMLERATEEERRRVRFVVVGDCSDLCTYQAAMQLHLAAVAANQPRQVIVPADAVDTFDTPVQVARDLGIMAHDGDLHHVLFLHHMALNGITVVRSLA